MSVAFDVPGAPVPQGSMHVFTDKRGRAHARHDPKVHAHRKTIGQVATMHKTAIVDSRTHLVQGPLCVHLIFNIERPKTVQRMWPSVRPDADKLARTVLDALTGVLWKDDGQVCVLCIEKFYAGKPNTHVRVHVIGMEYCDNCVSYAEVLSAH